jgi:hypothetical protein
MVFGNGMRGVVCAAGAILLLQGSAIAQVLTDTSDGVMSVSIPFGNLTPGTSSTPASSQVQFRIRSNNDNGYKVQASAVFNVITTGLADGGTTVSASDIGVGISSLVNGNSVRTPRVDTIAAGFDYNPATVSAVNGLTPYTGMASGRATVADILANPSITILSGPKIANNQGTNNSNNCITVTITFGLVGQFFTPATFSGLLTLTIVNGP